MGIYVLVVEQYLFSRVFSETDTCTNPDPMAKFTTQKKKMNTLLKIKQSINGWSLKLFQVQN